MAGSDQVNQYEHALAYITALTGSPDTVMDFRCIHDTDKAVPAHNYRGTLAQQWYTLIDYNNRGYGIFCNINCMDGVGRDLANVHHIRTHIVDLDNTLTAQSNYEAAIRANPQPHFAVQTSPGKFHVYWRVEPYTGNEFYNTMQRKLRQLYDGDKSVIDPTRVLRVPGFYHLKAEPFLVNCWALSNTPLININTFAAALSHVNVIEGYAGRFALGEPSLAAPSLEWLVFALGLLDPNDLDYSEWVSFTAAFKQSGWSHASEQQLLEIWLEWCARYEKNDPGECLKIWNSLRDTEVGWPSIERRTPVGAHIAFGHKKTEPPPNIQPSASHTLPSRAEGEEFGELLDAHDCKRWFKDCYFINRTGEIFSLAGRFMNATKFNGVYGGKHFMITSTSKTTDEAWKAALRSTIWTIPKVDHVRFLPDRPLFDIILDPLGRKGLNTYIAAKIDARPGDVTPWLQHVAKILPNQSDQNILHAYLAHCAKYPGAKIPWAPMLQSAEGVGKTAFIEVMQHAVGEMYTYTPKAQELVSSGSKFNAWMRGKLMIFVNEIKTDERRELLEILKPMITDAQIEVQSKGVDQEMEDNPANWLMFSNFKDAIPISKNGRRFSIFYSALQSKADILAAGMDEVYFNNFWAWLREQGGKQAIAHWLLNYPIERGGLPVRAPETSSYEEALKISRSPIERMITEAVEDGLPGFRGGYVSVLATLNRCRTVGIRQPAPQTVQTCLETMGYVELGRAHRPYAQESVENRTIVYASLSSLPLTGFGVAQGYE